ncbi:MAG: hypothetical protein ABSD64_01665 [Terriglobales bacterium]|jgi:hypothetical protein
MQKFLVLVVFLGLVALPLMAQDEPKVEVFGGYQYMHLGGDFGSINANGFDGAVTGFLTNHIGVTGDFSGTYKSGAHVYTYSGGPTIAFREGKLNPFVHVLFGGATFGGFGGSSINGLTMMFGGGADYKASKAISIRLADFDWVYFHANGTSLSSNVRLTSGIVFRF